MVSIEINHVIQLVKYFMVIWEGSWYRPWKKKKEKRNWISTRSTMKSVVSMLVSHNIFIKQKKIEWNYLVCLVLLKKKWKFLKGLCNVSLLLFFGFIWLLNECSVNEEFIFEMFLKYICIGHGSKCALLARVACKPPM